MEEHDSATYPQVPILVLLDLRLPKVDGLEVLTRARSHPVWKQVPVVVLTTSRENTDVEAAYRLGANSYIIKPVDFLAFAELVKTIKVYWLLTNEAPFPKCGRSMLETVSSSGDPIRRVRSVAGSAPSRC
jgi:two-component system response regulator